MKKTTVKEFKENANQKVLAEAEKIKQQEQEGRVKGAMAALEGICKQFNVSIEPQLKFTGSRVEPSLAITAL